MPNAKTQRQGPNATYIPLAGVGGLASGNAKKIASANAKYTNMLVYFGLGNAKFWRRVHCPTPTPDARYFAFWWNIGLSHYNINADINNAGNNTIIPIHVSRKRTSFCSKELLIQ